MLELVLALSIAFPKEGQRLPPVAETYVIGAVGDHSTNVVVRGESVPVYRTGAWATMVSVRPGTNEVTVGKWRRTFFVETPTTNAAASRTYSKLKDFGDQPLPHPAGKSPGEITIVLDAGHGGMDSGALSPHGWQEQEANLLLALAVRKELLSRGFKVVMTREDNRTLSLYDRPTVARKAKADAFVSIHHNAPPCNKDPRLTRYDAVYAWNPIGERLAAAINARMAAVPVEGLGHHGVLHANFAVTRNPEIPSCLIEADFVTAPEGEESIWDEARRRRTAAAIAQGIADWSTAP